MNYLLQFFKKWLYALGSLVIFLAPLHTYAENSCTAPPTGTLWKGFPTAIAMAQALNAPDTLPNVVATVYQHNMINPGVDIAPGAPSATPVTGVTVPIWVLVPPSYFKECNKRYPVVYNYDGQYQFDDFFAGRPEATFPSGIRPYLKREGLVDEILADGYVKNRLKESIGEFILVNIANQYTQDDTNRNRRAIGNSTQTGVVQAAQVNFLVNVLKPMIDSEYRTLPDRENTLVSGASAGSVQVGRVMFLRPDFASRYIFRSTLGLNSVDQFPFINSLKTWNSTNLPNVLNSGGMKVYIQYAIDATTGGNFEPFKSFATTDINYLLNNGFTLSNGTNYDAPYLLVVEPMAGLRGDSHRLVLEGVVLIDGLLRLYNKDGIDSNHPFHIAKNPSKFKPPEIVSVPSSTSVQLKLKLPQDYGYNYKGTDSDELDIQEWMVFKGVVDPITHQVTYDNGTIINGNTLLTTNSTLYQGTIRTVSGNLNRTTDLTWTVTNLDPDTTYVFKICGRTIFSLCVDSLSDESLKVKPSVGVLGNLK